MHVEDIACRLLLKEYVLLQSMLQMLPAVEEQHVTCKPVYKHASTSRRPMPLQSVFLHNMQPHYPASAQLCILAVCLLVCQHQILAACLGSLTALRGGKGGGGGGGLQQSYPDFIKTQLFCRSWYMGIP